MNLSLRIHPPREYFLDEKQTTKPTLHGWNPRSYDHSGSSGAFLLPSSHLAYMCLCYLGTFFTPTSSPLVPRRQSEFEDEVADFVFLVGPPASGKSSLYFRLFQKHGYARIVRSPVGSRSPSTE